VIPNAATPAPSDRTTKVRTLWPRGRPVIMGILNYTPDSFFDGGRFSSTTGAVGHALNMIDQGADIIDIGGESTRPGAHPVTAEVEIGRIVPIVAEVCRQRPDTVVSVDTSKARVAAAALEAGADLVNDVSAAADPEMLEVVASSNAGIVLMHMRGRPRTMQEDISYADVTAEVHAFLSLRARDAIKAGLPPDLIWLDPGVGFGKDDSANIRLLVGLADLGCLGHPIVVGVSRKSMIGRLADAEVGNRLPGSLAALTPTISLPRAVVRVHDVEPTLQFLKVLAAIEEAKA